MTIVMNMSGYEIEHLQAPVEEYGEDVLCSGWNTQLALVSVCGSARVDGHNALPSGLENVDVEVFLRKMYACQR
jgi:hypothetical protein